MHVYDFDGTLYKKNSTLIFCLFCLRKHPVCALFLPGLFWTALLCLCKLKTRDDVKSKYYTFMAYLPDWKKTVADFWERESCNFQLDLFPPEEERLVISASPVFLLHPLVVEKWQWKLIASEVDPLTGKFTSDNCYGKEKVRRFKEIFPEEKVETFYSDSGSDAPMALFAEKSFIVKKGKITSWDMT